MSIEGSNTVASHKPVISDASRTGKSKGAVGSPLDALGGAGGVFSALLNSFDSEVVEDDALAQQMAMDQPAPAFQPPADPLPNFLPQDLPSDLQLLLAQANEVSVDKSTSLQAMAFVVQCSASLNPMIDLSAELSSRAMTQGMHLPLSTVALITDLSSQAVTPVALSEMPVNPMIAPSTDLVRQVGTAQIQLPASMVALATNVASQVGLTSTSESRGSKQAHLPPLAGTTELASQSPKAAPVSEVLKAYAEPDDVPIPAESLLAPLGQVTQLRPLKARASEGLSGIGNVTLESPMQATLAPVDIANRETTMMAALVSGGFAEGLARPADRSSGKPSFVLAGSGAEGIWGQTAFQPAPGLDASSVAAAESAASSMESVVADTVSYWVTQGVKNAAFKLDGFGEHPLEVNISMQGGEARIDFRTDQPEIRQILEGTMTHLKELLKSEGVVLSGVSVGASGKNGAESQDGRDRPGARQGTVVTTKNSTADSSRVASLPAGRVLDLFV